jgi:hypothetical protein
VHALVSLKERQCSAVQCSAELPVHVSYRYTVAIIASIRVCNLHGLICSS